MKSGIGALSQVMLSSLQSLEVCQSEAPSSFWLPDQQLKVALVITASGGTVTAKEKKLYRVGLASIPSQGPTGRTESGCTESTTALATATKVLSSAAAGLVCSAKLASPAANSASAVSRTGARRRVRMRSPYRDVRDRTCWVRRRGVPTRSSMLWHCDVSW